MRDSKKDMDKVCFASIDVEHDLGTEANKSFRGVENMKSLLAIFQKFKIPLTLFVTGDVMRGYEREVKEWGRSYEIAGHSYSHTFFDTLSEQERSEDVQRFNELYASIFARKPFGFRAPSHIIDEATLRILESAGFLYDSSFVPHYPPFKKYRGYKARAPLVSYRVGAFVEIPVAGQIMGIPLAGAWIKKLPIWVYGVLFIVQKPRFITLSMHSWDALDDRFAFKLIKILAILKNSGYVFKSGEQIAMEQLAR